MNCKEKLLEVRDIHKVYTKEGVPTKALNGITFDVLDGEFLGIMGASGSGKTTLIPKNSPSTDLRASPAFRRKCEFL